MGNELEGVHEFDLGPHFEKGDAESVGFGGKDGGEGVREAGDGSEV